MNSQLPIDRIDGGWVKHLVAAAVCLLAIGTVQNSAAARDLSRDEGELARIDGVAITVADADGLRAILQPPPSRERAGRLAVDAALAFWDMHGWLAGSSAQGRLDAWRFWIGVEESQERTIHEDLQFARRRADLGKPGSKRSSEALRQYLASIPETALHDVEWLAVHSDSTKLLQAKVPWTALRPEMAQAGRRAEPGQIVGPVVTEAGMFWIRPEDSP